MKKEIRHICLAEDDPDDYYLFSKVLNEINSNIKLNWFQTCEHLLQFLETDTELPCLIILDVNIPKMGGQECLNIIKNEPNLQHIPVIIFSTAGQPKTINMAYQAGASKYILKPFSLDEFRSIVRDILTTY